ncbi:hypothetical protein HZS_2218, partial [Henneguya salminicola]
MDSKEIEIANHENGVADNNTPRDILVGFKQPDQDLTGGVLISGPGVGPSGMQPRPLELRKAMPKITRATEDSVSKAKRFAMEQSASFVIVRQVEQQTDYCPIAQVNQSQRQRIVNLMCRIYVGGVGVDIREDTIKTAFSPFGPIRRIDMSWDSATQNKGFAFVEFEVPDSAELALDQMNNTTISGRPIKVTRSSNAPNTTPMIESILDEARPFPRVFISHIHPQIHSRDLRTVFEAFGKIRSCVIIGERNPKHKGIAYIEYEEHKSADEAMVSMNNFSLGGQSLRVGKAVTIATHMPEDKGLPPASALAMAAVSAKLQGKSKYPAALPTSDKKGKDESLLNMPPIDNLISAIISPAMVQAGLSDLAADLVNTSDIQSIIAPDAFKHKHETRKRLIKAKDLKKITKLNDEKIAESKIEEPITEAAQEIKTSSPPPKKERKTERSRSRKRLSRSRERRRRSRSRSRRRLSRHKSRSNRRRYRTRSRSHDKFKKSKEISSNTLEDVSIRGTNARLLIMQKLARNLESNVIMMRNLVTLDQVDDQLKSELEQECSKYGKVKQVVINREKQGESADSSTIVKIFVQFSETRYAERAHAALNTRF